METLFFNGEIVTLEDDTCQQAMLVNNGIIEKLGSNEELLKEHSMKMHLSDTKGMERNVISQESMELVDLKGKTVLPGFIDAHSHLSSYANSFLQAPLEKADSFADLIERLQDFATKNNLKKGQWLIANGYDHNKLKEKVHPDKKLLDDSFKDYPVVLQHQSGHFGVFNSAALKKLGLSGKDQQGYLEENTYVEAVKRLPLPEANQLLNAFKKALYRYASYGITTIQEGMMVKQMLPLYQMLLSKDVLFLDVVGYPQIADADVFYEALNENTTGYHNNFRLGGYKIILDGSPQGRTAWMKTPYTGTDENYGVSTMSDTEVTDALNKAVKNKRQLLAHCNGDAASEQLLSCGKTIEEKETLAAIRPVIIHAQLLEMEQLPCVKRLGFLPSFFVAHCYYWGDVHIKNFGMERAKQISPAKSALDLGICFTFHQDTPVIEPDMLQTVWCAVNRRTKNGLVLGEQECISVLEALKAVTVNAAYQYGEESTKGTLAVGKFADFIVLDKNPLHIATDQIKDIQVLQTYKRGTCIYQKKDVT